MDSDTDRLKDSTDVSKVLLDLLLAEYNSECNRITELDNKAFRGLAASGFITALLAIAFNLGHDSIPHLIKSHPFIFYFLLPLLAVSCVATWTLSVLSIRIITIRKMSVRHSDIDRNYRNDLSLTYERLLITYVEINQNLHEKLKQKTFFLNHAQYALLSTGIIGLLILLYSILQFRISHPLY